MATKIKPLGQRVLVKRLDEEEKSAGGIIIPDTAKEKPQEAEVVALGVGKDDDGRSGGNDGDKDVCDSDNGSNSRMR